MRVYDKDFNYVFATREYSKMQATLRYYGVSNLAVAVSAKSNLAHYLQEGMYLTLEHNGRQYPFVVLRRTISAGVLTAQAASPHTLLSRRITVPPDGKYAVTSTGSPDKVVKAFVRACISGARALPITLTADRAGTAIAEQSRLQNLGTEVERICQAYGLGERWTLDADNKCFIFDTYAGTDRTQGNTADNPPCIFAAKYRNLADYEYDWDGSGRQTTAIVAGQGEGTDREIITVGGTASGVDRYEVFVDARDVAKGDTALLTERGTAAIIDAAESITTEESQNGNLVFGVDYDLGDMVTVRITVPEYKLEGGYYDTVDRQILINQRITEAIITTENGEYNVDLKYGEQQITRAQTLTQDVQRLKADAPADAGDYIVECGVDGIWTYRKYASGLAECWCRKSVVTAITNAWGSLYTSGALDALNIAYPFAFVDIPVVSATLTSYGVGAFLMVPGGQMANTTTTAKTGVFELARGSMQSEQNTYWVNYHVSGRYK